jgi:hypothetical protein
MTHARHAVEDDIALPIRTEHASQLLSEAKVLADSAHGKHERGTVFQDRPVLTVLQRAANLARLAAAALDDELLRARDGWPKI